MRKKYLFFLFIFGLFGCAVFDVKIHGDFNREPSKNLDSKKVTVLFVFKHTKQLEGLDAIPKLVSPSLALKDFNDIFLDALKEFSNIESYNIISETSHDIEWSDKQKKKEILKKQSDYVIETTILKKESFAKNFLGGMVSLLSLSLIPINYPKDYTITTRVYDAKGNLLKEYIRTGSLKEWLHFVMIFYYPYHSPQKAVEEFYSSTLHNIFKEIEYDRLLK